MDNQAPFPDPVIPGPAIIKPPNSSISKILGLLFILLFLVLILISVIAFFSLDYFKTARFKLFREYYLGFSSTNNIPSPLHLDNPAILNFGATYLLQGKITALEPNTDGNILLRHDIKGIPPLMLRKDILLRTKAKNGAITPALPADFQVGQTFQTSVAFTYSDKTLNVINITAIK